MCMAYKSVLLYVTIQSLVEAVLRMEFWIVTVWERLHDKRNQREEKKSNL